jgi:hypothetical protein
VGVGVVGRGVGGIGIHRRTSGRRYGTRGNRWRRRVGRIDRGERRNGRGRRWKRRRGIRTGNR